MKNKYIIIIFNELNLINKKSNWEFGQKDQVNTCYLIPVFLIHVPLCCLFLLFLLTLQAHVTDLFPVISTGTHME